jgi:hypothetical protein
MITLCDEILPQLILYPGVSETDLKTRLNNFVESIVGHD